MSRCCGVTGTKHKMLYENLRSMSKTGLARQIVFNCQDTFGLKVAKKPSPRSP
jgi:hypothetical protein